MKKLIKKIKRSGLIEFIYISTQITVQKVLSIFWIFILRLRGYDVKYSVTLGRQISFFQGKKNSIRIGDNAFIENGVRIRAGFDGSIHIGDNVRIHDYSFIYAHEDLVIGDNTMISPHVFITDFNHKFPFTKQTIFLTQLQGYVSKKVKIGKNVWIGANAIILPGVTIGDAAVIGAGSVVVKNVPPRTVVVGNPARVVKKYEK